MFNINDASHWCIPAHTRQDVREDMQTAFAGRCRVDRRLPLALRNHQAIIAHALKVLWILLPAHLRLSAMEFQTHITSVQFRSSFSQPWCPLNKWTLV
jgi:hypothetical protein